MLIHLSSDSFLSFLDEVSSGGENAAEFFQLYQRLTRSTYWKFHLGLQGALLQIGELITKVRKYFRCSVPVLLCFGPVFVLSNRY